MGACGSGNVTSGSYICIVRLVTYEGLDLTHHLPAFEKVRASIERDDLRSPDVKKLSPGPYYRAKLDDTNRLLLQFLEHQGEKVCLALEVIENHAYDRARFLRGAKIDESKIAAEPVIANPEASPIRYLHRERAAVQILDKPISFDDAQEALLGAPAPLVVVGSAGSGKTAITLARLRQAGGAVAYVTQSAFLAESARAVYYAQGWAREDQEADFLSHRELVESIRVPPGKPVSFRAFADFFARHRRDYKFADAHQCFEELRGVIGAEPEGPLSRAAYLALGPRQSIFAAAEREALHALFGRYRAWLNEAGLYDPNLVAQEWLALVEPRYDFLVVDEVQDLTNAELTLALRTLRKPGQFLLCGDANQIVHPNFFSWARVRSLFFRPDANDELPAEARRLSVLASNYRNARAVTRAANRLLEVKHARFGSIDRESDTLIRPVGDEEGLVATLPDEPAVVRELDEKIRRSARVAVIVLRDEEKDEARRRFHTPLVFSVHEAKGLEYDTVILYGLVSSERATYAELAHGVRAEDLGRDELRYGRARDKDDRSLEIYKFFVNALYVALTRAIRNVYLVESDPRHPLLGLIGARTQSDAVSVRAENLHDRRDGRLEARRPRALQGKVEQAEAIRATVARREKVPWTVIDTAGHDELAAKALAPNSIFTKAKQALFDWACFHQNLPLAGRLERARFPPAEHFKREAEPTRERRQLAPFAGKHFKDILAQTDRFGVDYRTPMGTTPLMMAAAAGNVGLVEALLARGARRDLVDPFGHAAMHHLLRTVYRDTELSADRIAAIWERVAVPAIDLLVDGRLVRLAPSQGEYFVLAAMQVLIPACYRRDLPGRDGGVSAEMIEDPFEALPDPVLPEWRRRRTYLNAVLARAEALSAYQPARRLWRRERRGEYLPNLALAIRVTDEHAQESWVPLAEHLAVKLREQHLPPPPPPRPGRRKPAPGDDIPY